MGDVQCSNFEAWKLELCESYKTAAATNRSLHTMTCIQQHQSWPCSRRISNCCWRESVKPLQFYCRTLSISYLIGERQLLFYRRLLCSDNIVLCTLAGLIRFEMLGIAAKYDIKSIYFSTATVKYAVLSSFVNVVRF